MTVIIYGISLAAVSLGLRLIVSPKRERDGMKRIYGLTGMQVKRWMKEVRNAWKEKPLERVPGLKGFFAKRKRNQMELEVYEAISFLRNVTALGKGAGLSADGILEHLIRRRGSLEPLYGRMLQLLRLNRKAEAAEFFASQIESDIGSDFARILIQWDELDPKHLMETLLSHQKNIKEARLTILKRRDEVISDLIYLPVVANVMLIFINFVYVGYFIDQRGLLTMFQ